VLRLGLGLAVLAVIALAYVDLRREEARALDDFVAEQQALARSTAATMSARVEALFDELELAARTGQTARARVVTEDGLDGAVVLPGEGRRRVFRVHEDGRTASLDLDLDELFAVSEQAVIATNVPQRLVLLDAVHPTALGAGVEPRFDAPGVTALLAKMHAGGAGMVLLDRPAADALGLQPRLAVAAYAPVRSRVGQWSVAFVRSARRVRDRARLAGWRLFAAAGIASALVAVFGLVLGRRERQKLELEQKLRLAETTSALRERSEQVMEVLPLGVMALDRDGRIASVNPWLASRGIAAGGTIASAFPDARQALERIVAEARTSRQPSAHVDVGLLVAGGRRELDVYAIPLARPSQDADCFVVLHDRTDERRLARDLVRAEKLGTIGTLAAGVAHEVGTPLGIISGRAEQLLERTQDESLRKPLTSILAQVDKVGNTIRQLLDFARVRPVEAQPIGPAQALQGAAALLEHRFKQHGVELAVEAPPTTVPVSADPGQLEQVLVNLLVNACDACEKGGHVWARAAERDGHVAISISDDGAGIAPEHLPLVLDPFFTTKKRGQGTGLGLSVVADIVRNHGGSLEIDSQPGAGTTVRVLLPRAA